MKRIKRLVSFRGREAEQRERENVPPLNVVPPTPLEENDEERSPIPRVQFQDEHELPKKKEKKSLSIDHDEGDLFSLSVPRRSNLHRTRSRSVECVKDPQGRQNLRRSILKAQGEMLRGSETSLDGTPHFRKSRSQSYYAFR